jgi:hypothetical protein
MSGVAGSTIRASRRDGGVRPTILCAAMNYANAAVRTLSAMEWSGFAVVERVAFGLT